MAAGGFVGRTAERARLAASLLLVERAALICCCAQYGVPGLPGVAVRSSR